MATSYVAWGMDSILADMDGSSQQPVPLLIDTDNALGMPVADVDDGVALAAALASPLVEVMAVCGCAGNCSAVVSARNSRELLRICGRDHITVAVGSEKPLHRNRDEHHAFLAHHAMGPGRELWAGAFDLSGEGPGNVSGGVRAWPDAAETIISTARRTAGELVVLSLGSLNNLAVALKQEPETARHIKMVVHMGGRFIPWKPDQMQAEFATPDIPESVWQDTLRFNTWYDPEASAEVFASGIPVVVVPVNVTSHGFLRPEHMEILGKGGSRQLNWLVQRVRPWGAWSGQVRGLPGAHMHDPMALAMLCRPDLFRVEPMRVDSAALLREAPVFLEPLPNSPNLKEKDRACCVHVAVQMNTVGFEQWLVQQLAVF